MEDVFEHRWRKAYEVRALERESRQASRQHRNAKPAQVGRNSFMFALQNAEVAMGST